MRRLLAFAMMVAALPALAAERPFLAGSWPQLLAAHAGRPTAVHFWSLTCAPCLAELPGWAELARGGGLDVVLVSTDPPEDAQKVERTLRRAGLEKVERWGFAEPFVEKLRFQVDRDWRGELPMTVLVSASGKRESVTGSMSRQDVEAWLARNR